MSATAVSPVLPFFHAVLDKDTAPLGNEAVQVPMVEFFTDGDTPKALARQIHAEYTSAVRARKIPAPRDREVSPWLPRFTAKPLSTLEKEWLGANVTFTESMAVTPDGVVSNETSHEAKTGSVLGLSGHAKNCLSVYVPGDGFYRVDKDNLTRVM